MINTNNRRREYQNKAKPTSNIYIYNKPAIEE